jgi:hypothetical protein
MQSNVTAFPRQAALPKIVQSERHEARHSGFFDDDVAQGLPMAQLAAAIVLAVHRGLVEEPSRQRLPLR